MSYGYDITEGLPLSLSNPVGAISYSSNSEAYDIAINDMPFFLNTGDEFPHTRETAQYRKQQIDQSNEPGEQSITGWWVRAQSSFHGGTGINFYDPASGESIDYRYFASQGVNPWVKGQVTLLKDTTSVHVTTGPIVGTDHQHPQQHIRSIQWSGINGVLVHDEYDVDKIYPAITVSISNKARTTNVATLTTTAAHGLSSGLEITITGVDATFNGTYTITGTPTTTTFTYTTATSGTVASTAVSPIGTGVTNPVVHFIDYNTGSAEAVYAICDDGVYAYWVTNANVSGTPRLHMYKKLLSDNTTTIPSPMFTANAITITHAAMEFVKDRIILCINNEVYELPTNATSLTGAGGGTLVYTNPNTNYHYTSVAASGPAIYTAGHSGIYSTIQKYTLGTNGSMPVLTQAVVAAEFPSGEIIEKIYYYLGYMIIGTSKGLRVSNVNDQDGSLQYGPLIFESTQPVYDVACADRFAWVTTGVSPNAGLTRVDLSQIIEGEPLRFAYATDLVGAHQTDHPTTAVAFMGTTNRLVFCTAYNTTDGGVYMESASTLVPNGYITTGAIRYGTLENKIFKNIKARIDNTNGGITIRSVDKSGAEYQVGSFAQGDFTPEASVSYPVGAQEYLSFKFTISRSSTDTTKGPIFSGYQLKSLPAVSRQRLISYPLLCYDREKDSFGNQVGHEGAAYDKLTLLETVESLGDTIRVEDFRTGESYLGLIESIQFINRTPSDKRFSGFGGILVATIRTI
jgi:hypothetical protein